MAFLSKTVRTIAIEETLEIAARAGIKHPADPYTKVPIVMTTDFLLKIKRGIKIIYHARTTKYEDKLNELRVLEKFEIERRYWQVRNVNWACVTEKGIPRQAVENARFLHPYYFVTDLYPLTRKDIRRISFELTSRLREVDTPFHEIAKECDRKLGLASGRSLAVARHLLARGVWKVNLNQPINFHGKLTLL